MHAGSEFALNFCKSVRQDTHQNRQPLNHDLVTVPHQEAMGRSRMFWMDGAVVGDARAE